MMKTPIARQIEAGAKAIPVDYYHHEYGRIIRAPEWDVSAAVLTAVLSPIVAEIEALKPDEFGRVSKGLVLAYLLGELP